MPSGGDLNIALLPMQASLTRFERVESTVFGVGFGRQDRLAS